MGRLAHSPGWWRALVARLRDPEHAGSRPRGRSSAPPPDTDEYDARHLIQRTLADKAALRRRAPVSREDAARYEALLRLELASLEELERALRGGRIGGPDAEDVLVEACAELTQLRTEIAWCRALLAERATAGR